MLCGIIMGICSKNHIGSHEYIRWETCWDFVTLTVEATCTNWYALKVNSRTDPSRGLRTETQYSSRLLLIVSHIRHGSPTVSSSYPKATCSLSSNLLPVTMKREKLLVVLNFPKLTASLLTGNNPEGDPLESQSGRLTSWLRYFTDPTDKFWDSTSITSWPSPSKSLPFHYSSVAVSFDAACYVIRTRR
jgi:hypothetical protein